MMWTLLSLVYAQQVVNGGMEGPNNDPPDNWTRVGGWCKQKGNSFEGAESAEAKFVPLERAAPATRTLYRSSLAGPRE